MGSSPLQCAFTVHLAEIALHTKQFTHASTLLDDCKAHLALCSSDGTKSLAVCTVSAHVQCMQATLRSCCLMEASHATFDSTACDAALDLLSTCIVNTEHGHHYYYSEAVLAKVHTTRVHLLLQQCSTADEAVLMETLLALDSSPWKTCSIAERTALMLRIADAQFASCTSNDHEEDITPTARLWKPDSATEKRQQQRAGHPILWSALLESQSAPHIYRRVASRLAPACASVGCSHLSALLLHTATGSTLCVQQQLVQHSRDQIALRKSITIEAGVDNTAEMAVASDTGAAVRLLSEELHREIELSLPPWSTDSGEGAHAQVSRQTGRRRAKLPANSTSSTRCIPSPHLPINILHAFDKHASHLLSRWMARVVSPALPHPVVCSITPSCDDDSLVLSRMTLKSADMDDHRDVDDEYDGIVVVLMDIPVSGAGQRSLLFAEQDCYDNTEERLSRQQQQQHPIRTLMLDDDNIVEDDDDADPRTASDWNPPRAPSAMWQSQRGRPPAAIPWLINEMESILDRSTRSMKDMKTDTRDQQRAWWKERVHINDDLSNMLRHVDEAWLGAWRCLLLGHKSSPLLSRVEDALYDDLVKVLAGPAADLRGDNARHGKNSKRQSKNKEGVSVTTMQTKMTSAKDRDYPGYGVHRCIKHLLECIVHTLPSMQQSEIKSVASTIHAALSPMSSSPNDGENDDGTIRDMFHVLQRYAGSSAASIVASPTKQDDDHNDDHDDKMAQQKCIVKPPSKNHLCQRKIVTLVQDKSDMPSAAKSAANARANTEESAVVVLLDDSPPDTMRHSSTTALTTSSLPAENVIDLSYAFDALAVDHGSYKDEHSVPDAMLPSTTKKRTVKKAEETEHVNVSDAAPVATTSRARKHKSR